MIVINRNPGRRDLRIFAGLLAVFLAVLGSIMFFRVGEQKTAQVIWAFAVVAISLGSFLPAAIRPVYLGIMFVTYPVGWLVSHLLMCVIFYLVLTPIGLAMRLFGRDPLDRRKAPRAGSYWTERRRADTIERYFRQF